MRKYVLAFVFLTICPLLIAQQPLNNESVVKLIKSGMSEDLIVSTISGSAGSYDTSAAGLATLKSAGASDKVIAAIEAKAPAAAKATIYLYRPERMKGGAVHWILFSNGDFLGTMRNANYLKAEVPAGNWELSGLTRMSKIMLGDSLILDMQKNAKELDSMTVEAGKTYYLRLDIGFTGPKFVPVTQATAEKDMRKCHPAKDSVSKDEAEDAGKSTDEK
jgi:hypothetical protein